MGYNITNIDGDLALGRNAEIGGDVDIHGKARVAGNLKVEGFFEAPNIKGLVKGLFATEEELKREYPNPRPGWCAIVLADDKRGFLYLAKNREWKKQSEESKPFDFIVDSINVFASKGELANAMKYNTLGVNMYPDKAEIYGMSMNATPVVVELPAATAEKAGVMSAKDKANLDNSTVKSITWNNDNDSSNMNDFVVAGVYDIKGEHTREDDNLPVLNTGGGHSFNARLVVLDSSITGTGDSQDKCITQVLTLSNRTVEDGNMYIRTGHGGNINSLSWKPWATLQTNINVETVDNLDNLKDNGIYSGVWTEWGAYPLTFVCIVINDYFVGVSPRRIAQFVYGLDKHDGSTVYLSRVWDDSKNDWGDWEILNQKEIAKMISKEIAKVVADAPETFDTLKEITEWIEYHGTEAADMLEAIKANAKNLAETKKDIANQLFATPDTDKVTITGRNKQSMRLNFEADIPAATTETAGMMTAADRKKLNNLAVEGTNTDLNTYFLAGVYFWDSKRLTNAPIPSDSVVSARLTVLTAYDGTSPVITQVLNLNNLSGGEGNIYIRSCQNDTWKPWGKLQTNVEVEQIVKEEENRAKEAEKKLEEKIAKDKTALINGDIIVGQAREVYSRTGKVDSATFLKRTTAGGTSVSDGVASVKQIGGNIVKNLVDFSKINAYFSNSAIVKNNGFITATRTAEGVFGVVINDIKTVIPNHKYYTCVFMRGDAADYRFIHGYKENPVISSEGYNILTTISKYEYTENLVFATRDNAVIKFDVFGVTHIDLTEMFGAGKEPTKEECDRMFACMGALPQGLTVAQPTGLKSTGFNQWNPANVLLNKSIVENAIEDDVADRHIAIVECLPCKIGTGENNGYIIGYGEGDSWSVEGIEVYFSPLNPMDYIGQDVDFYMHKLEADSDYSSYVPQCKGYLLIVTPTIDKLCVHFHWSGDREITDYEEYVESNVALPTIPEMSEWGLAGIQASGTLAADIIDLDRMVYTKRIGCVDLGSLNWGYNQASESFVDWDSIKNIVKKPEYGKVANAMSKYTINSAVASIDRPLNDFSFMIYNDGSVFIKDDSYNNDATAFKQAMQGVMLYYELATPEEYPIVTKTAPNYIGSDYGVEEFTGSKVPLTANILFYMRSLAGETRNFIDQLYTNTQKTDAKEVANYITKGIEENKQLATNAPNLALRALYIAAGAEYNDSGADKTKTAPWGETVTHKAGHYYLNGLGNITETQMRYIYNRGHFNDKDVSPLGYSVTGRVNAIRTNLPRVGMWNASLQSYLCVSNKIIEVVNLHTIRGTETDICAINFENTESIFADSSKLSVVDVRCLLSGNWLSSSFKNCSSLREIRVRYLKNNIIFAQSPLLSKATVLYMIQNATPTSAITITLHPDAYARLAEDADIVAALEAQPLVTLVSA